MVKCDGRAGGATLPDRPLKIPEKEMAGLKETIKQPSTEWANPIRQL